MSYGCILHATDFSEASARAFDVALAWARDRGAELVILHVVAPPVTVLEDSYVSPRAVEELQTGAHRDADERLTALVERARRDGVQARPMVLTGVPFEQISEAADRLGADMVVIGTHGRTGLSRLLLGSVAERVVGLANRPVLTVRGDKS